MNIDLQALFNQGVFGGGRDRGRGGGDDAGIEALLRALQQMQQESETRRKSDEGETRARRYGSQLSGATPLQASYVRGAPDRQNAAGTVQMVNRQRTLRAAGLPDQGKWVDNPRAEETEGEYVERMQKAHAEFEKRKAGAAQKNRDVSAAQKARGGIPRARLITQSGPLEPDKYDRAIRQRDLVQGRAGIGSRDDEGLFNAGLKSHLQGPMPKFQPEGYKALVSVGGKEKRFEDPDLARISERADVEQRSLEAPRPAGIAGRIRDAQDAAGGPKAWEAAINDRRAKQESERKMRQLAMMLSGVM